MQAILRAFCAGGQTLFMIKICFTSSVRNVSVEADLLRLPPMESGRKPLNERYYKLTSKKWQELCRSFEGRATPWSRYYAPDS